MRLSLARLNLSLFFLLMKNTIHWFRCFPHRDIRAKPHLEIESKFRLRDKDNTCERNEQSICVSYLCSLRPGSAVNPQTGVKVKLYKPLKIAKITHNWFKQSLKFRCFSSCISQKSCEWRCKQIIKKNHFSDKKCLCGNICCDAENLSATQWSHLFCFRFHNASLKHEL